MSQLCKLLGVTRHGYYSYQQRQSRCLLDPLWQAKIDEVKALAKESDYTYGYRRIRKALQARGYTNPGIEVLK